MKLIQVSFIVLFIIFTIANYQGYLTSLYGNNLHLEWSKPDYLNKGLPSFMEVYFTDSEVTEGVPFNAWFTKLDYQNNLDQVNFIVQYGIGDNKLVTPQEYAENYEKENNKKVYAVLNGGFFNMETGESLSLTISDRDLLALIQTNQKDGQYPSIGAFGVHFDGSSEAVYAHQIKNQDKDIMYGWNEPNPNPEVYPDEFFPENGFQWQPEQGIGGGPLLIKNGQEQEGDEELFNDNIMYGQHPRSAICRTSDNQIILYVNDGRSEKSTGLQIYELRQVMKSLDCVDAINLDGGGSTCLYVNNQVANVPSDGHQRPVSTVILITEK